MNEKVWTPLELVKWTQDFFAKKGIESGRLEAELLLASALGCKRIDLYVRFEQAVAPEPLAKFKAMIQERAAGKPNAYLTGSREFYGFPFSVTPAVLIPRPETETLVEQALELLGNMDAGEEEELLVADIGCGSGCIGLALAGNAAVRAYLTDISKEALVIALQNAEQLELTEQVQVLEGDLFEPLAALGLQEKLHAILSNPPYIGESEKSVMGKDVLEYEPHSALFADNDGLAVIERLLAGAAEYLRPGGILIMEVGYTQRAAVEAAAARLSPLQIEAWHKDLLGHDRVVVLRKPA